MTPTANPPGTRNRPVALAVRILLGIYAALMFLAGALGPRRRDVGDDGADILLTGTFHSGNWIRSHLLPLALSPSCRRVRVVTHFPIPPIDKVERIVPGETLSRIAGRVPARLATFLWVALRSRPHAMGGFHLLMNGLVAALAARAGGGRAVYFCVGGPAEVQGGGILSENRLFERLGAPDAAVETTLLGWVAKFDLVVTMGSRAKEFFRERGAAGPIEVVPGGIDADRFGSESAALRWDVAFVGRLVPVKQVDLLLRALALVKREVPGMRAVIVGDGPMRAELERLSAALGLGGAVEFAGLRDDIPEILHASRVFALTSKTEGLSLALMEAMMSGVPAVVSDVGDLRDLVRDGGNGFLVDAQTPERFAQRIAAILRDAPMRKRFSEAARAAMERHEPSRVAGRWDAILESWKVAKALPCAE